MAFEKYDLPNLQALKEGGTSVEKGIMTLPVHPTIWPYGAYHTTSLPNITTLAGTMFIDEKQHFFHHDLPEQYITLHAGGSNAYRSMNPGFDYSLADGVPDRSIIDFTIGAFDKEGDIQFSRIHLQETGYAGRIESGKQQSDVPWAKNIFAEDSPYGKAVINADKEIGRLFDYLKGKGKWDSTLIVFMGDGQAIAGWHLYMSEDSWLTPVIFHGPRIKKDYIIPYAENIDVIPTIAWLWNIQMKNTNGGTGRVLKEIAVHQPARPDTEHPQWTEKINRQLKEYNLLKAKADILSAHDPAMNLLLMELMHEGLSEHQFYNYDRIIEWKKAGTLEQMYNSNQWVINELKKKLKSMETNTNSKEIYQIRIYELNDHNKEQFLIRFKDHASRIMKRHGFDILNMWEANHNGKPEFVYMLKWKDEEALRVGWEKFFSDEEWIEIRDRTNNTYGSLVGERKEDRILRSTNF
ncbi:MAG TPA: hypothetical protein DIT04_02865 [Dysgonomonas sp.]|nr:hypothetical protein [Dysgonomonas sp.]